MTFSARPPAKLNLTLDVDSRAADGFHPLRSVFLRMGLSDRLTVNLADDDRDSLTVTGDADAPVEGNTVLRALALVRRRLDLDLPPLRLELEKRIPAGAGLAGGSSDGAAALALSAACWGVGLSPEVCLELASEVGSDVPFFASGARVALVEGRGERVTPLPEIRGTPGVLLVAPPLEVSTPLAFARFDDIGGSVGARGATDDLVAALRDGLSAADLAGWTERLNDANDLWPAAASLAPELSPLRDRLETATGRAWLMTGSGSALFTLYPSVGEAAEAADRLAAGRSAVPQDALILATDLDGPDPVWRKR